MRRFSMGTEGESMLQLAAEAFQSKNFDLAAEIYECQLGGIVDPGTRLELMVKRADALVFGGKLTEAFGVYRQASEIHRLTPVHLDNLLEYLSDSVKRQEVGDSGNNRGSQGCEDEGTVKTVPAGSGYDAFSCRICLGFLFEPVTLPCGHSFCKKCLERERREKETPVRCKECSDSSILTDVHSYRVNVVLCNLLFKWFPTQSHAVLLRREGNGLYTEKKMQAALEKYNEAILLAPKDHILFSNRSQIHSSLKLYEEALQDAETACRLMPHWSKGHVRKAQALLSLGRSEEALVQYLVCLSIEPDCKLARSEALKVKMSPLYTGVYMSIEVDYTLDLILDMTKLLRDLLAPVPDQVPDRVLDYASLASSRIHIKHSRAQSSPHVPSQCSAAPYKASQALSLNPPFSDYPQCPCESNEGSEVKGQGETGSTRLDRRLLLKRKRRDTEEGEVPEAEKKMTDGWKRAKSESAEVAGSWSSVVRDLIDPTDLECSLCMRLFYEPVTTPCGHTFCLQCLERCLDHNPKCPLCKEELAEHLARRQYCKTVLMENLISKYLPSELKERQKVNQEELAELSNLNKNVPIFVCTMAFPTVPCPLHIFEPCYRLMIRRCMETGTKCFGMCLVDNLKGFADYGCLLEIRNVEFFSDGRSVVDTIGRRRFKVIQHSQRDGYNTADIEYLEDVKVEGVAQRELQSLHDAVYDQALVWLNSLKPEQKERIIGHFGPMPEKDSDPQAGPNGPSWCWWLLAVLPLEGRAQLPFLALTSLKERLSGIRRVLLFMARSRHR